MKASGGDLPVIIGQEGPLNGQRFTLETSLTIGRDDGCDILVPDRQVSRYHARLSLMPEGVLLEDLGSKNGTFVRGQVITDPVYLQDGDDNQVALTQRFVFLSSDATVALDSAFTQVGKPALIRLERRSRRVWVGDQEILPPLSASQFKLLEVLYSNEGQVVSRQALVDGVWGDDEAAGVSEEALDALIRRLRERLTALNPHHNFISTIRGHGLRLDNQPD